MKRYIPFASDFPHLGDVAKMNNLGCFWCPMLPWMRRILSIVLSLKSVSIWNLVAYGEESGWQIWDSQWMITLACGNLRGRVCQDPQRVAVEHSCVIAEFLVEFGVSFGFSIFIPSFNGAFWCSGLSFWLQQPRTSIVRTTNTWW